MRTASELGWLRVREYRRSRRHVLEISAADGYPSAARIAGTPLLASPHGVPPVRAAGAALLALAIRHRDVPRSA